MRVVIAALVAILLVGGSAAAQSPAAPSAPPPASAAPGPGVVAVPGPTLVVTATNAKVCRAGTTCHWFLTLMDASGASPIVVSSLQPGDGRSLEPSVPLPTNLAPGTYLTEASAWVLGVPIEGRDIPTGRVASCSAVVIVPADASRTVHLRVRFRRGARPCEIAVTVDDPATSGAASPGPAAPGGASPGPAAG